MAPLAAASMQPVQNAATGGMGSLPMKHGLEARATALVSRQQPRLSQWHHASGRGHAGASSSTTARPTKLSLAAGAHHVENWAVAVRPRTCISSALKAHVFRRTQCAMVAARKLAGPPEENQPVRLLDGATTNTRYAQSSPKWRGTLAAP